VKILIILEDPRHDQFIVKPVIEKLVVDLGRRASVEVLRDPHLRGVDDALNRDTLAAIVEDNPMIDLFLLIVDRDGNRTNNEERITDRQAEIGGKLIGCLAVEEVEVWMLALHADKSLPAPFREIRKHFDPKEAYADPFLERQGWATDVGGGRKRAMDALAGGLRRLLSRCPEVRELRGRLEAAWPKTRSA
jgi:hypothetical protein